MNRNKSHNIIKANFKKRKNKQNNLFTIALLLLAALYIIYKYNASTATILSPQPTLHAKITLKNIKITDGDSFKSASKKMRLYGIDAPEYNQRCTKNGIYYNCGQTSKNALHSLISNRTKCAIKDKDRYGRSLVVCYNNGQDINAEMVKQGHAVAYTRYSNDYIEEERYAKNNKLGIWRGEFIEPEQYRINKR